MNAPAVTPRVRRLKRRKRMFVAEVIRRGG
jgi:hypothetical protein